MWHTVSRTKESPSQLTLMAPSFCNCIKLQEILPRLKRTALECKCGEDELTSEWGWESITDDPVCSRYAVISECKREANFHPVYSCGTAVVRGNTPFLPDRHYYWEMKILTELYGTDVMIGVGSENTDFDYSFSHFCSFLGRDSETYGYSYTGKIQHDGHLRSYGYGYDQGVIVGVHLDMWLGTLEFFINRKPMGIAFRGLKKHKTLYPMMCSTASLSGIRLIYSMSYPATLFYDSLKALSVSDVDKMKTVPGFKKINQKLYWILELASKQKNDKLDDEDENWINNSPKRLKSSMFPKSFKAKCENFCGKITQDHLKLCESAGGKLEQSNDTKDNQNYQILKNIQSSNFKNGDNSKSNDDIWLTALGTTAHSDEEIFTNDSEGVIKFSTRLVPAICETCNVNLAITIRNKKTPLNKCLQCFYDS